MKTGLVYKIELNENNIYIGSTTNKLCKRQGQHNYELKKKPNRKLYKSCIENNITVIKCVWVADVEYSSNAELRMIEEKYRTELNGNLNMVKCYTSEEDRKEYIKEYRENNKKKRKEFYENNKDKIKEYKKEYYEKNKDKINEKINEKNKNKINEKIKCNLCGCTIVKRSLKQHQRTNKCKLLYECIFSDSDSD